ncbi:MAG TPA: cyclic pyranopterin monophosphate synthase MoaC [Pyrodictium sp.]|nr:cyclic pyranopterin monophosphate synthase MoaC [Pyrodictium sp.]
MVDISGKKHVLRIAEAYGRLKLKRETIERIRRGNVEKGNPFLIAKIAAINAAKMTPLLLPLCHPIPITHVNAECGVEDDEHVYCRVRVKAEAKTGVEMEALTAVAVALLNIWDVVKMYEKDEKGQYPETQIELVKVVEKLKLE